MLGQLRRAISVKDRELVRLLAERAQLAAAVKNHREAGRDDKRERLVRRRWRQLWREFSVAYPTDVLEEVLDALFAGSEEL